MEHTIQTNRWSRKFGRIKVTKKQQRLMDRLAKVRILCEQDGKEEIEEATSAILEFLPHYPVLAVIMAETYKVEEELLKEIKETFNVTANPGYN